MKSVQELENGSDHNEVFSLTLALKASMTSFFENYVRIGKHKMAYRANKDPE